MRGAIAPAMARGHHAERLLVWQLSDQLRREVVKLTKREPLDGDTRLRVQLRDAADEVCRNVSEAFGCDRQREFGRFVRKARSSVSELQDGIQAALARRRVEDADVAAARDRKSVV